MKNKGITLISLVVTVIVLLILAGITIGMLTSNNNILSQSHNAKIETEIAGEKEILQLATYAAMTENKEGYIEKGMLCTELNKYPEVDTTEEVDEGVEVTFKSGRIYLVDTDGEVIQKTPRIYSDEVKTLLTEGKYVTYDGQSYRVLYDVNSGYNWIEIISINPLGSVLLGYQDSKMPSNMELINQGYGTTSIENARWSYNNAITTLHENAQGYLTDLADRARCVGSNPEKPNVDVEELGYEVTNADVNAYIKSKGYNNKFKVSDENYTNESSSSTLPKDKEQLEKINAKRASNLKDYWLASRYIDASSSWTDFGMYVVGNNGANIIRQDFVRVSGTAGSMSAGGKSYGIRPVIRLKDTIKITGGSGTSSSPYTISL